MKIVFWVSMGMFTVGALTANTMLFLTGMALWFYTYVELHIRN